MYEVLLQTLTPFKRTEGISEVHPAALYRHRHDSAFACHLEDESQICGNLLHVQFLCQNAVASSKYD